MKNRFSGKNKMPDFTEKTTLLTKMPTLFSQKKVRVYTVFSAAFPRCFSPAFSLWTEWAKCCKEVCLLLHTVPLFSDWKKRLCIPESYTTVTRMSMQHLAFLLTTETSTSSAETCSCEADPRYIIHRRITAVLQHALPFPYTTTPRPPKTDHYLPSP